MPSHTSRRVAAIAMTLIVSLLSISTDALAKSRMKLRAATTTISSPQASYYTAPPPWSGSRYGGVLDNTAGWGNVGAR
jgi:hypothetical protein